MKFALLLFLVQGPQLPRMSNPAEAGAGAVEIASACGLSRSLSTDELLKREYRLGWEADRVRHQGRLWADLACVRGMLSVKDVIAREGPEQPLGAPWSVGAVNAAVNALRADRNDPRGAAILALLSLRIPGKVGDTVVASLRAAIPLGDRHPEIFRACSELMTQARLDDLARGCAVSGLQRGVDSTWHRLRLARLDYRRGDSTSGRLQFALGLSAARDSASLAEVLWHLQWFLSPEELAQFRTVSVNQLSDWVQLRLAARDIKDGRPLGARLAAHFSRMDFVFDHFRLALPRFIERKGGLVASRADNALDPWSVLGSYEPGAVPAMPYRFYSRWQTQLDDRGVVYLRYGAPDTRLVEAPFDNASGESNWRELWRYVIDGQQLLLNFEGERFDGSVEATRLVSGVLGSYMCGVDAQRCALTERSKLAKLANARLSPENLVSIRDQDDASIRAATTRDDNSPRGINRLDVRAGLYRMWDPTTAVPIAVVPVMLVNADGDQVSVHIAQLDARTGTVLDTTILSRPVGVLVVPRPTDLSTWSAITWLPGKGMGRNWADGIAPLPVGPIRMSDLMLGTATSPLAWNATGTRVPIHLGSFDRKSSIQLYFQVLSEIARPNARSVITVTAEDPGSKPDAQTLRIDIESALAKGLTEVERELDLSRLTGKRYRIEIAISDATGSVRVRQVVRVELK